MPPHWVYDAMFYHIYPLGFCGAPRRNDFSAPTAPRLEQLYPWLDHIQTLNLNAVYLGPVFESTAHGYDTADYFQVDRRLGNWHMLRTLIQTMKARGLRVILDGVFNHVGRDFWAFRDVLAQGSASSYADWFYQLNFGGRSPYGDPFSYTGWAGHYDLVKLNLNNPAVRSYLFEAVSLWQRELAIDGLRLDAADHLDPTFVWALASHCRANNPDFWLMGEVVHGDYNRWANPEMLDATTNYEAYKGLYSSHVDVNYFEIAYSLNRQFGTHGIYRDLLLYNFADNHDVNRVASQLTTANHLYPLYLLLFTMPGVPSIYYGSEWGIAGKRSAHSDEALRPCIALDETLKTLPNYPLEQAIRRFAALRTGLPALRRGEYCQLHVAHEQLAFARSTAEQTVIVALNAAATPVTLRLTNLPAGKHLIDHLNQRVFPLHHDCADVTLYPHWGSVLTVER
jgi:cyclomaltodextrinase / maltogenic alpha-amylase / neopullulanase